MDLLDKQSACDNCIQRLHSTEWANRMQRCTGQNRDPGATFCESVIDRNQGDQQEEKPLDYFSYPDTTWTKDANAPAKQSYHTMTSGISMVRV